MTAPPIAGRALVRRPGPHLAGGIVTHIERQDVDLLRACRQWDRYVDVLDSSGWSITEVSPADDCPDRKRRMMLGRATEC